MNNPFQEQLLKAGLVNKKQIKKANQEKSKNRKQHNNKAEIDKNQLKRQQAAAEKAKRDRELNLKKEQQARNKAISAEINQLVKANRLLRDENCNIIYHFEHRNKIHQIHINKDMKQQLVEGKLALARIEGHYELVPFTTAEKIRQRNEKRIVMIDNKETYSDIDDPYAEYQVPDDLMW